HSKKMLKVTGRHSTTIVFNYDALLSRCNGDLNVRCDANIDILKAVNNIFPNYRRLRLERGGRCQQIPADVRRYLQLTLATHYAPPLSRIWTKCSRNGASSASSENSEVTRVSFASR